MRLRKGGQKVFASYPFSVIALASWGVCVYAGVTSNLSLRLGRAFFDFRLSWGTVCEMYS